MITYLKIRHIDTDEVGIYKASKANKYCPTLVCYQCVKPESFRDRSVMRSEFTLAMDYKAQATNRFEIKELSRHEFEKELFVDKL